MMKMFEEQFGFDFRGNVVADQETLSYAIFDEVFAQDEEDETISRAWKQCEDHKEIA